MADCKKMKLGILISHPIQYQVPLFAKLAADNEVDLLVYFSWTAGLDTSKKSYFDVEFKKELRWDIPLLEGYAYKFLRNYSSKPSSKFFGQINFGIIQELIKSRHDVLLVYGWNSFTNWIAFITAFVLGIPVILHGENPLQQELKKSAVRLFIKRLLLGTLFKVISGFLYIGEENKKFFNFYKVPDSKLFFAPYAVDNERFIAAGKSLKAKRGSLRREDGIPADAVTILFVGKLIEKKRPLDLLRAFQLLTENRQSGMATPKAHLLFVGDGVLRLTLEQYVREYGIPNVHFAGFKNQTELPRYYILSDVFVLPSGEGETWGLVVNEAMCFGLAVVVSSVVGCGADLVRENENGFVFRVGEVHDLARRLGVLAEDKSLIKKFGEASRIIVKRHSYGSDVEGILRAIHSVIR